MTLRGAIGVSLGCSLLLSSAIAFACSVHGSDTPFDLIPGLHQRGGANSPDAGLALPEVPRNVAFLNPPLRLLDGRLGVVADDANVALETTPTLALLGSHRLHRAESALPIGATLAADPFSAPLAVVGERIDTSAPPSPTILSADVQFAQEPSACGGESSCGDITSLRLAVAPTVDDQTPTENLYYALFIGVTRQQLALMIEPTQVVLADQGELLVFPSDVREDFPLLVSIVAIDFAGNMSERSEPFVAHSGNTGCMIARVHRAHLATWCAIGLALALLSLRRRPQVASRGCASAGDCDVDCRLTRPDAVTADAVTVSLSEERHEP